MSRLRARVAIAAGVAAFLVLVGTGAASAGWTAPGVNASASASGATTSMTLGGSAALATQYKFTGGASPIVVKPLTVANIGSAPLTYSLAVSGVADNPLAASVKLTLWRSTGATCAATPPTTGSTVGTLAAPPALPADANSAASGVSLTLCAATQLTTTTAASQGRSVTPTISVTGQVGGWSTSATDAAFAQSVYQVPDATALTCTPVRANLFSQVVTLAWTAPANTGSTGAITYRVVDATNPATVIEAATTSTSVSISYNDLPSNTTALLVQTLEGQYATNSVGLPITLTRGTFLFGLGTAVYCPQ